MFLLNTMNWSLCLLSPQAMVQYNRIELLSHPVCQKYLQMKWSVLKPVENPNIHCRIKSRCVRCHLYCRHWSVWLIGVTCKESSCVQTSSWTQWPGLPPLALCCLQQGGVREPGPCAQHVFVPDGPDSAHLPHADSEALRQHHLTGPTRRGDGARLLLWGIG